MTKKLEQAARDASEALGISVEVVEVKLCWTDPLARRIGYSIEVCPPLDDESDGLPLNDTGERGYGHAKAYLEGLEAGARIQRERHRPLVEAAKLVWAALWSGNPSDDDDSLRALAVALKELEA